MGVAALWDLSLMLLQADQSQKFQFSFRFSDAVVDREQKIKMKQIKKKKIK